MKVRIVNNSIRFRLKEPEVNYFSREGKVSEILEFGSSTDDRLEFRLESWEEPELGISYHKSSTIIHVPRNVANKWTKTEMVGFDGKVSTGDGRMISILVEKDFMCMDGREEENIGSYPNPLSTLE
jgi:hypothetical protein